MTSYSIARSLRLALTMVVALSVRLSLGAEPTADELLRRFETALSEFDRVSFRATTKWFDRGNRFPSDTLLDTKQIEFVRINDRFRVRYLQTGSTHRLGGGAPYEHEFEVMLDGDHYILRRTAENPQQEEEEHWSVDYRREDASAQELHMLRLLVVPRVLFGCYLPLDNDNGLAQIMRSAGVTKEAKELVDGHETVVISSRGEYGVHTLWLDPAMNYLPRRIVNLKTGRDLYGSQPLNEVPVRDDPDHRQPNLKLNAVDFELANVDISRLQEKPVLTRFTTATTYHYAENVDYFETKEHTLSAIDFDPDPSSLQLTMHIPDGTRVRNRGEDGLQYEWQNGGIVTSASDSELARAGSSRFSPETPAGASRLRMLIIVNVIALVVVTLIVVMWRRRRKGS